MQEQYDYDVRYMQDILQTDLLAYLKFLGFQTMYSHTGKLSPELLSAVRIHAILWDDCGPCTQLIVNIALESKVNPAVVRAIIDNDLANLSGD